MKSDKELPTVWSYDDDDSLQKWLDFYHASHTGRRHLQPPDETQWESLSPAWAGVYAHHGRDTRHLVLFMIAHHGESTATPSHGRDAALIAALQEEQTQLRMRLRTLESKLDEVLSLVQKDLLEEVPLDPYTRWIQDNLEQLRQYPDSWVALDPKRGVVFHAADGAEFDAWINALPDGLRTEYMILHTSMYV